MAGPVTVQIGELTTDSGCIVGAAGTEVVIGRTVLDLLDLTPDETSGRLARQHPEGPVIAIQRDS